MTSYSLWYSYTPAADGLIKATTSGDVMVAPMATLYQGSPGSLTQVGCRGDVVAVTAGTTYYIRLSVPGCCFGTFTLDVTVPTPPANDLIENATPITSLPFTATQDNTDATVSPTDPPPSCNHGFASHSVWYSYTPATDGAMKATPSGPLFASPMATIYEGSPGSLTQVGCSGDVVAVTAGATYYIRLSLPGCCPGTFTLNVTVPNPPANDLIENATPITSLPFTATQDNTDATVSPTDPPSPCAFGSTSRTLWYSYTAAADGLIRASIPSASPAITIYQGTPDSLTQVGCGGDTVAITAGSTYYVMVAVTGCCPGTFTLDITVPNPPANDLIENATAITSLPFTATQTSIDATVSPTDPPSTCASGSYTLWYSYTAPTEGLIKVRTSASPNPFVAPTVTVLQGEPGSLTQLGCGGQVLPVTAGTTYYVMLSGCCPVSFTLDVTVPTPPSNDEIANATAASTLPFTASHDNTDATPSASDPRSTCVGTGLSSVWYAYTAPADGAIEVRTSSPTLMPPTVSVYHGPAASLTQLGCSNPVVRVTAGVTYYIMLSASSCCLGPYTIDITPATPPANDLIENATHISVPFSATQDSTDATISPTDPTSTCVIGGGVGMPTMWYSFTAPSDGLIKIRTAAFAAPAVTLYHGAPGELIEAGCGEFVPVTAGTTYHVMLSAHACCTGPFTFDVTMATPPPNDLIENATPITTLPFNATQSSIDTTASPGDPSSPCTGTAPTVWYSYTATFDGLIGARITGGFFTGGLTIYQGAPGSLTQIGCGFPGGLVSTPVVKDASYYVAVAPPRGDSFTLDVTELLTISLPADLTFEATGPSGVTVEYSAAATLPDGSPAPIDCAPASGSVLSLGDTTITCTASDNAGHALTRGFVVHVVDTTAPALTVPATVTVDATGPDGAAVTYTVSATDIVDLAPTITCDPPPETSFAIGDTTVRCVATDFSGNSSNAEQFTVRVNGAARQLQDLSDDVAALPGPASLRISLGAKLHLARVALARDNRTSACAALTAFILEVHARSGRSISTATATVLIADASRIRAVIAC